MRRMRRHFAVVKNTVSGGIIFDRPCVRGDIERMTAKSVRPSNTTRHFADVYNCVRAGAVIVAREISYKG